MQKGTTRRLASHISEHREVSLVEVGSSPFLPAKDEKTSQIY